MATRTINLLATWFYLGHLRPAPGTWGTIGAIPLVIALNWLGPMAYLAGTILFAGLAIAIAQFYEQGHEGHDRSEVVIDEVAGFLVAMAWVPMTWAGWLVAFALFRLLDILKPPPLNWLDREVRGGVGVVADDLGAGILVNLALQVLLSTTTWLN